MKSGMYWKRLLQLLFAKHQLLAISLIFECPFLFVFFVQRLLHTFMDLRFNTLTDVVFCADSEYLTYLSPKLKFEPFILL